MGGGSTASPEEHRKIREFWDRYAKTDEVFQIFYSKVNGTFDIRYLPDDLYYTVLDPFYKA